MSIPSNIPTCILPPDINDILRPHFAGKHVLITGGLGFIGSALASALVALDAHITLLDSLIPEYGGNLFNIEPIKHHVRVNISDVRDEHAMKYLIQGQDYLFNLAGQTSHLDSMIHPYPDLDINARAQLSILEACRHYNPSIRIVFASTRQLYGKPQYLPVDEQHPIAPIDVNGVNKLAGEWYHLVYHNAYHLQATVLRLTNTFGPRMRIKDARQTFLGIWIRNLLEGKPIHIFGTGEQVRDYNVVDDVVECFLRSAIAETTIGRIFNVGADERLTLTATAELLIEELQALGLGNGAYHSVEFPADRKAIDIGDYYSDYRLLNHAIGWSPRLTVRDGVRNSLSYFSQHLAHYV